MEGVSGEPVTLLKLKVGDVQRTGAVGDHRADGHTDHALLLTDFYGFGEADEVVDGDGGHLLRVNFITLWRLSAIQILQVQRTFAVFL